MIVKSKQFDKQQTPEMIHHVKWGGFITLFLGGGFENIVYFHPYLREDFQFDEHIFRLGGWNQQLVVTVSLRLSNL